MDENDNDSVKVTIRVKISDDDYQDIHFDWSKVHTYDMDKSIFEQLSAFTGIKTEAVRWMVLRNLDPRGDRQSVTRISNPCLNKPLFPSYYVYDRVHERFPMRDGDCYRFSAFAKFDPDLTFIYVTYVLLHQDLVDETECNRHFCHQIGSRVFLDKLAKVVNSDIDSYLNNLPDRPRPRVMQYAGSEALVYDGEWYAAYNVKENEILKDLNIGQYLKATCPAESYHDIRQRSFPRHYWPNRG